MSMLVLLMLVLLLLLVLLVLVLVLLLLLLLLLLPPVLAPVLPLVLLQLSSGLLRWRCLSTISTISVLLLLLLLLLLLPLSLPALLLGLFPSLRPCTPVATLLSSAMQTSPSPVLPCPSLRCSGLPEVPRA